MSGLQGPARLGPPVITAVLAATVAIAAPPPARADRFVECGFGVAAPFLYSVDGADYMASRVDVSNCRTNLPSTPLTFQMHLVVSGAPASEHNTSYAETRDVHNGDSFSVVFPNDGRRIGLYPGVYGATASVLSTLPGFVDGRWTEYKCSTWPSGGVKCPAAQRG